MERLFVLKTLSRTQRATKVKKFVGFSLKPLRCRDPALPPLYGHAYSRPFFLRKARMRIIVSWWTEAAISCVSLSVRYIISIKHVFLRRGFCTLVLSFPLQWTLLHCKNRQSRLDDVSTLVLNYMYYIITIQNYCYNIYGFVAMIKFLDNIQSGADNLYYIHQHLDLNQKPLNKGHPPYNGHMALSQWCPS